MTNSMNQYKLNKEDRLDKSLLLTNAADSGYSESRSMARELLWALEEINLIKGSLNSVSSTVDRIIGKL